MTLKEVQGDTSMTTKISIKLSCFFFAVCRLVSGVSPLRAVVWCLSSVICFSAASAWADSNGNLYVDNLTVSYAAAVGGGEETNRKTESELRQVLKQHYEQDCYPNTVTNQVAEIRFTNRDRIVTGN
jgi:hypothetical protein